MSVSTTGRHVVIRAVLVMLCLATRVGETQAQQRNVVFQGVPEFLRNEWQLVLGPSPKGGIDVAQGSVIVGNEIVMFTMKPDAKVISDYSSFDVTKTIQYNIERKTSATGYDTLFELTAEKGDLILYPGQFFWRVCIRFGSSGPYAVYSAIQAHQAARLKADGLYNQSLASQRTLLEQTYQLLAQGLR